MTERRATATGLNRTAALLLVAYLDVAILGGVALIAHWTGNLDQHPRGQVSGGCSTDELSRYKAALNEPVGIADAIGSEESDVSGCLMKP